MKPRRQSLSVPEQIQLIFEESEAVSEHNEQNPPADQAENAAQ